MDRVSGSCTNALTLYATSTVEVSATFQVRGTSSDSSTVSVAFRKRGQTAFTVRRRGIEPAGQQGVFMVAFSADDDYRLYAANDRCDSPPILVTAAPVETGPKPWRQGQATSGSRSSARSVTSTSSASATSQIRARLAER